eukprot:s872_g26.t1
MIPTAAPDSGEAFEAELQQTKIADSSTLQCLEQRATVLRRRLLATAARKSILQTWQSVDKLQVLLGGLPKATSRAEEEYRVALCGKTHVSTVAALCLLRTPNLSAASQEGKELTQKLVGVHKALSSLCDNLKAEIAPGSEYFSLRAFAETEPKKKEKAEKAAEKKKKTKKGKDSDDESESKKKKKAGSKSKRKREAD